MISGNNNFLYRGISEPVLEMGLFIDDDNFDLYPETEDES